MRTHFLLKPAPFLLSLTLAALQSHAADAKVAPTISVAKTEATGVAGWQPALGEGLAQMMITELGNLPNFKVLESVALDDLRAERAVGVETGSGFNFSSYHGGGFNDNREFMDSALGKATMKAIAQIVEKLKTLDVGPGARTLNAANAAAAGASALRNVKGVVKLVEWKEVWVSLRS